MKARYEYDAEDIQRLIVADLRARGHDVADGDVTVPQEYAVPVSVQAADTPRQAPAPVAAAPAAVPAPAPPPVARDGEVVLTSAVARPPPERAWNSIEGVVGDPRYEPPPLREDYTPRVRELGAPASERRLSPQNPWKNDAPEPPATAATSQAILDSLYGPEAPEPPRVLATPAHALPTRAPAPILGPTGAPLAGAPLAGPPAGEGGIDTSFLDRFLRG